MTEGRKDDQSKPRLDLLPPDALLEVGEVLTFGANKYAARNWEKGIVYGRVIGAALRHIFAIMRGEDRDPETGRLHAAHAICCLLFLCSFQLRGMKHLDDRNDIRAPFVPPNPLDDVRQVVESLELRETFKDALNGREPTLDERAESWREPIVPRTRFA